MDPIDVGCAVASVPGAYHVMRAASALGHGAVAGALGAAFVVAGRATGRSRLARLGVVLLVGVVASGVLANLLKLVVESPRPSSTASSYGFPSGHTTIAFAFAAIATRAFPRLGPVLFLLAVLTAAARLYLQAHFTIDIVGGAVLGTVSGAVLGRLALPTAAHEAGPAPGPAWRWLWIFPAAAAALLLPFFVSYERVLGGQRAGAESAAAVGPPAAAVAFGRPEGRAAMLSGWSEDERWAGMTPFVWAEGDQAVIRLGPLGRSDHDLRLRLAPFVVKDELPCQHVTVDVNGSPAGRLLLDRGWSEYHVRIAGAALRAEENLLRFRFAYASRGQLADPRRLAVAFGGLEARPAAR